MAELWSRVGVYPNTTDFEIDGTLHMNGAATVFRDELGDLTQIKIQGSGIAIDTAEVSLGFQTACDYATDYVYKNVQFNHDRLTGATLYPHIHWWQTENTTPNFLVQYRWINNGKLKNTAWISYPLTTNVFTYTSGTLNQITSGAGLVPTADDDISSILQLRFTRDKTNASGAFSGSDTYTTTAQTISFDIHVQLDTLGSRTQYSK